MDTPINQPRRHDRQISDEEWIKNFLRRASYGVMATSHEHQPFLNPNLFVYDETENAIFLHNATQGRTTNNIKSNERICFLVSEMGRLLPADEASEFSVEYASVIIFGRAQILDNETEMIHGLQLLMDKYFPQYHPGKDYPQMDKSSLPGVAVIKITIESWSAKEKKAPIDYPGAFDFKQVLGYTQEWDINGFMQRLSDNKFLVHQIAFALMVLPAIFMYLAAQGHANNWIWFLLVLVVIGNLLALITR